ncbi:hypothetical protein [Streptomyces sp. BBFR109]|uniref:hypothetical protein n=1 Tax=Streptomyces sp. BBFR109 TaxID=3448172 RepID=UPI003F763FB6
MRQPCALRTFAPATVGRFSYFLAPLRARPLDRRGRRRVLPALSTAYLVADECATDKTRIQAGTWVNSAFKAGGSGGTTTAGLLLGQMSLPVCFVAAAVPALASTATALVRPGRTLRPAAAKTATAAADMSADAR